MTTSSSTADLELESTSDPRSNDGTLSFPVIGVGASAGGLEAFVELLQNLSDDPRLAVLFVLHLQPNRETQLVAILSNVTKMTVEEATEGTVVRVNHVYVLPPDSNMALHRDSLVLIPRSAIHGPNMPVDHLFRSLASTLKNRAIGVILSGGGSDGVLAFQSIKAQGGVTFAQDEKSARQIGMPRSAIRDGNVDYILPPHEIARELRRLAQHPYHSEAIPKLGPPGDEEATTNELIALLRDSTGIDFTYYKRTTIKRRLQRRMALRGINVPADYLALVRSDQAELNQLYQDFLIRVTQFFQEPEAFEVLKEKVFPAILQGRAPNAPIRIWVAGCASGEEVYSLAIALLEYLGDRSTDFSIKIMATDVNEATLEKARTGLYVDNIEIDVSSERLRRFFVRSEGYYQIGKSVRDLCIFSRHNLTSDPPLSRLDLVSCRNVMIYMDASLQKRVIPILHYALNLKGFLFLGGSESVSGFPDLFEPIDMKLRIFSKLPANANPVFGGRASPNSEAVVRIAARDRSHQSWSAMDVQKEADRVLLARYAPVGVVIDETGAVIQFRGRTSAFLEPAPGMATLDLMRMLREGLLVEVRSAWNRAKAGNVVVTQSGLKIHDGAQSRSVGLEIIPFKVPPSGMRFFLVLFLDEAASGEPLPVANLDPAAAAPDPTAAQLQQELNAMRDYLQSVIEEQESTNEELQSANEEILSANEELQSTNEELQTAKEEAQSTNEELATVNEELQYGNAELGRANNDLINLLNGVNIPIVMVSRELRIRRFTPPAEKVFNLIATDVGRPIGDIRPNLRDVDLSALLTEVIDTLMPYEGEVLDREFHSYSLRIRPYVASDRKIDGASLVLVEIGERKGNARLDAPATGKRNVSDESSGRTGERWRFTT